MQTVKELRQKAQGKSIVQIVSTAISNRKSIVKLIYKDIVDIFYALNLIRYRLQYPGVKFGSGVKIRGEFSIKGIGQVEIGDYCAFISYKNLPNKIVTEDAAAKVTIGQRCCFSGTNLSIKGIGQIEIGNYCDFAVYSQIANNVDIQESGAKITIGERCAFNGASIKCKKYIEFKKQCLVSDAIIVDTDYHSVEINRWDPNAKANNKPIYIGENVWLCSQSVILKGVSIGNNSVIGLGTIVRQSVPENVVIIGNPQQIVKKLDTSILPYKFPENS